MQNLGFQITINEKVEKRVGIDSLRYSVSCIVSSVRSKQDPEINTISIDVGGLNAESDHEYLNWIKKPLIEGDKILIEVISSGFDAPSKIDRRDSEEVVLDGKLKAYYALKEELKDHIRD